MPDMCPGLHMCPGRTGMQGQGKGLPHLLGPTPPTPCPHLQKAPRKSPSG
jgi:hypothetical protein